MDSEQHSYRIGLIIADIEDNFSNALAKGAMKAAAESGDSLFIYPVKYLDIGGPGLLDPKQQYEYQYNMLFAYAKSHQLDFILMGLSSIGFRSTREKCLSVLDEFKDIPTLLLCSKGEACSSAMYDNVTGLRQGIEYLFNERGCKHPCMLSGLFTNEDAVERESVFRDIMISHGMEPSEKNILHIRDSKLCDDVVEELLSLNPDVDAIVCFNDETAKGVYQVLEKHGLRPGRDIAVLGFDDISESSEMDPPLATIRADAAALCEKAFHSVHEMLSSGNMSPRNIVVNTEFILRESASGLINRPLSIKEYQHQIQRYKHLLNDFHAMDKRMNVVSRDMLMFRSSDNENYTRFIEALKMPEIGDCYLYVFERPVLYLKDEPWKTPDDIYLRACKIDQKVFAPPESGQKLTVDEIYGNPYFKAEGKVFIFIDIYSRSMQYGVLMCEIPYIYFRYIEQLCFQISIALKIMNLFESSEVLLAEKEEILKRLEKENLMLGNISNTDELTEILNRRGFVTEAFKLLTEDENMGKGAALFYADLNYLKLINDRYGHSEGDFAIKACADVISKTFSRNSIVARIGGDEFAVLTLLPSGMTGNSFINAVKDNLSLDNLGFDKPYIIRLSIGVHTFRISDSVQLKQIMEKADEALYQDKLHKPAFDK